MGRVECPPENTDPHRAAFRRPYFLSSMRKTSRVREGKLGDEVSRRFNSSRRAERVAAQSSDLAGRVRKISLSAEQIRRMRRCGFVIVSPSEASKSLLWFDFIPTRAQRPSSVGETTKQSSS